MVALPYGPNLIRNLNNAAFERLRWSIFDPAGTAGIAVADHVNGLETNLTPYANTHPIASEYVTLSLERKIVFFVETLGDYESHWHDENEFVDPHPVPNRLEDRWDALIVQRGDKGPLTVGDVVTQSHAHFQRRFIKDRIRESLAWTYNEGYEYQDSQGRTIRRGSRDEKFVPEDVHILFGEVRDRGRVDDEGGEAYSRASIHLEVERWN